MSQTGDDTNEGTGDRKAKKRALERSYYTQFQACARKPKRESKIKNDNDVIGLVVMIPASSFGVNWAKQTHGDDYLNIVYEGKQKLHHHFKSFDSDRFSNYYADLIECLLICLHCNSI